jgi:thiol:disulfide interchange protein DsbD
VVFAVLAAAWSTLAPTAAIAAPRGARASLESLPDSARAEAVFEADVPQLVATLVVADAERAADAARIGVLFELAPGWHLYWRNPGETGVAPEIAFDAPGHAIGALEWPAPETFREADDLFTTWGYEGRILLGAPLERTRAATPGQDPSTGSARADVTVLVCKTQCVPAAFSLALPLDAPIAAADRTTIGALFRDSAARVPPKASALGWTLNAEWIAGAPVEGEAKRVALTIDPCPSRASDCVRDPLETSALAFLPFEGETFEFDRKQWLSSPSEPGRIGLELELTRLEPGEDRLRGVVELRARSGSIRRAEIDVPVAAERSAAADAKEAEGSAASGGSASMLGWLQVFLLALVGGFVLNGMPCVLPVLAIKVVSVADMAERDAREVRLHGLAYTGGVLGSMIVLAAIVLALRQAGHAVGWGFQFQEPLFVAGIAALLVTFALNLFGVFEIELGQGRLAAVGQDATGLSRSVFEGLLAVVLATPCTAPFLGTAVGFAFASSGFGILAIFVAIGIGLASPFLLVSFFPRLARFVPRSGPWMLKLRAGLGFCLLGTVVWLLWIVGQSGGTDAVVALLAALLFLAFLLWTYGALQPMRSLWLGRASAIAIAALAFASFNAIDFEAAEPAAGAKDGGPSESADGFSPYDPAAVRETLAEGTPAFVVFTADWCITCKVNERTVLDRPIVRDALARGGYALFKADWTRRDDTIRAKLAEFGRAGVPLYLVYDPGDPDRPRVLSELLTQDAVVAALAEAGPPRAL